MPLPSKSLLLIVPLVLSGTMAFASDDDTQLCADAETRYQDMFGAPSSSVTDATIVLMYEYRFCPAHITVDVGTTVRWVNVDKRTSHSVIVGSEPESDRAFPEEIIEYTFTVPGPVDYLCGPHWERREMIGSVEVLP